MLDMLKAELSYSKMPFIMITMLTVLIPILESSVELGFNMVNVGQIILFMIVFIYLFSRIQEGRDRMHTLLTKSYACVGLVRLAVIFIAELWLLIVYMIVLYISDNTSVDYIFDSMRIIGVSTLIGSLVIFFTDITIEFGKNQETVLRVIMIVIATIIMAVGILYFNVSGQGTIADIKAVIDGNNPFTGNSGAILLLVTGLLLSALTVYSFKKRKSYAGVGNPDLFKNMS
jgi:hypothetical protein